MKYLWVDSGVEPDFAKIQKAEIDGLYFDMFNITSGDLQELRAMGYAVGVYMASNWDQFKGKTGPQIAEIVHQRVDQLKWGLAVSTPKVQFDMEEHAPTKIASCLERWRQLQPKRDTSWTMEPMQGGWMSAEFSKRIIDCKVRIVPQAYIGRMANIDLRDSNPRAFLDELQEFTVDTRALVKNLWRFPDSLVSPLYDASFLPQYWNGFAFTQRRLP